MWTYALEHAHLQMPPFAHVFAGLLGQQGCSSLALWCCSLSVLAALQDGGPLTASVLGLRTGIPRAQRLCQWCNLHALNEARHLVSHCPDMQGVRDWYPALFSPAKTPCSCSYGSETLWGWLSIYELLLWCLVPMMMLLMMHQQHLRLPWRLDR